MLSNGTQCPHNVHSGPFAGVTQRRQSRRREMPVPANPLKSCSLVHTTRHYVNPGLSRRHKRKSVAHLAPANHSHIHGASPESQQIAALMILTSGEGGNKHALGVWQVFIQLAHKRALIVQQIRMRAVINKLV